MQRNILFSVIIPIYNTEKYLKECLDSVICNSTADVEIIMIDDASDDGSTAFMSDFENRHKDDFNVRTIYHSANKGQAVSRNEGLSIAEGQYILFLDSDDMLQADALSILKDVLLKEEIIDIVFFDANVINETDTVRNRDQYDRCGLVEEKIVTGIEYMEKWYFSPLIVSCCMCVFRREYLLKKSILFREGYFHEDNAFNMISTLYASNVRYINKKLYIRRYRDNSTMTREITLNHLLGKIKAIGDVIDSFDVSWKQNITLFNKFIGYIYRESNNLFYFYSNGRLSRELFEDYLNTLLSFAINDVNNELMGYTWYSFLQWILSIMEQNGLVIDLENEKRLRIIIVNNDYIYNIAYMREVFRKKLITSFPLNKKGKKVGIYGIGNYTKNFLGRYMSLSKISSDILFIDSYCDNSFERKYMGRPLINYNSIPKETDMIIVSSFNYRIDILKNCKQILRNQNISVFDIYEKEAISIDQI